MLKDLLVFFEFHSKWFFAILVYQNFLLFLIMFYYGKWIKSRSKLILSQFFLVSGIIFLAFLFQHTGKIKLAGKLNFLLPGGFFLIMPYAYFYLRALVRKKYESWIWGLIHFIPAAIFLLVNFILAFRNRSVSLNLMNIPHDSLISIVILQIVLWGQFLFYTVQAVRYLRKERWLSLGKISIADAIRNKWQLLLFTTFGLYSAVMAVMIFDSMVHHKKTDDIILYILAFITITLIIGLFAIKLKDLPENISVVYHDSGEITFEDTAGEGNHIPGQRKRTGAESRVKSQLTPEKREELISKFNQLMDEKYYRETDCNLGTLAKKMNSNSKYVSEVVHSSTGMPFSKYITELRINEAKKLLEENNTELYSIEGIGRMVGFQSKSSFNTHFKQLTGMTPSEYLQKLGL